MNLKIVSVHEKGKAKDEYVLLEVLADCNVSYYGVADTTYTGENNISNKLRHFYWFPPKDVKAGQLIVLQTGVGANDQYTTGTGKTVHRFFWGLGTAVWNDNGDAAVLFQMNAWNTTRA